MIIRRASEKDVELVTRLVASSFASDPVLKKFLGLSSGVINAYSKLMVRRSMRDGFIYLSRDGMACALLSFSEKVRRQWKEKARIIIREVWSVVFKIGVHRYYALRSWQKKLQSNRPGIPYMYLLSLAVEETHQGRGLGSLVLAHVLSEAERRNRCVCLDASSLNMVRWLERHDFDVLNTVFEKRGEGIIESYAMRFYPVPSPTMTELITAWRSGEVLN